MSGTTEQRLSPAHRQALLVLARAAIADSIREDGSLEKLLESLELSPPLEEPRATFVTLKEIRGEREVLRGCIGTMAAREPLYRSVIGNARRSALRDPRFSPVTEQELAGLRLEISVLTPLREVEGPGAIVPGRDGVELEKGANAAVFLPQVATEQGWDTQALLENLALKALLPRNGWKGAKLSTFQAEVFGEEAG